MKKINVGMVLFPGFQLLDIAGARDALAEVGVLSKKDCQYDITTVGTRRNSIISSSGLEIKPDRTIFDPCPNFDTLIIPGGLGIFDIYQDETLAVWINEKYQTCRRIASICNGIFALGSAGLINNKNVTTHWMDAYRAKNEFPLAKVNSDHIHIKDGNLYTTGGVTAGIDLTLMFIEEDFGRDMAIQVAKFLLVYIRRDGNQSQFSPLLDIQASNDSPISTLQNYMINNLDNDITVESLAEMINTSPRNLSRMFINETKESPISFLNNARLDKARILLESTITPLEKTASLCGFKSSDTFRRAFLKKFDITPGSYRNRFRSAGS